MVEGQGNRLLLPLLQRFTADKGRSGLRCCRSGWRRMCRSSPDGGSRLRVRDVRGSARHRTRVRDIPKTSSRRRGLANADSSIARPAKTHDVYFNFTILELQGHRSMGPH